MYQRDYLMRQIEQAAKMLAAIVKLARGGRPKDALGLFDQVYKPLLGVSSRVVSTLTDEQLISLLTSGSVPDLRRVASVLDAVKAEGDVLRLSGEEEAAASRYRRALSLAGHLAGRSTDLLDPEQAAELVERADGMVLSGDQRLALARVLESLGRYDDAEDAIFEAVDDLPHQSGPVDAGIAYYQRLLALPDDELEAGGLPRDEVKGSLAELLGRKVPEEDEDDELAGWPADE